LLAFPDPDLVREKRQLCDRSTVSVGELGLIGDRGIIKLVYDSADLALKPSLGTSARRMTTSPTLNSGIV
jgi:hypothetical protein